MSNDLIEDDVIGGAIVPNTTNDSYEAKANTQSNLPSHAGKLHIDFQDDFLLEKSMHLTEQYLEQLFINRRQVAENHTCGFCGFPDGKFLEIHHIDGNHTNFNADNLLLVCTLCHRLHHLGWVGVANLGKIIYLPSIPKTQERFWLEPINNIQRFFLMQEFLSNDESTRLQQTLMSRHINDLFTLLKSQDFDTRYFNAQEDRKKYLYENDQIARANDGEEKTRLIAEIKEIREKRKQTYAQIGATTKFADLHILDLLNLLKESANHRSWLEEQNTGKYGRMTIWFNQSVFAPFEPNADYTLEERLDYYQYLGYFSATGINEIMHNIRLQTVNSDVGLD